MSNIAIITARGGSKRVPRKNIKEFCGEPILTYSIRAALESECFDTVMVSTDDQEIAEIAKKHGAEVPFLRSSINSNDHATTSDVLLEVIEKYEKIGEKFENGCCIYPTAPFITAQRLFEAMEMLMQDDVTSVIPVLEFDFPPQRAFVMNDEHFLEYKWPQNEKKRSQDLEKMYHDSGQFYCFRISEFKETKSLIGRKTKPIFLNPLEVQDIDTVNDWEIAEIKYKILKGKNAKK